MTRVVLHLLLALTLLTNAVSAPWAMAHMRHGDHGHGMHHDAAAASDPHAAHHLHDDAPAAPVPMQDCCSGAICHCGCMLPPVVPLPLAFDVRPPPALAPAATLQRLDVALHTTPPFRPPAA